MTAEVDVKVKLDIIKLSNMINLINLSGDRNNYSLDWLEDALQVFLERIGSVEDMTEEDNKYFLEYLFARILSYNIVLLDIESDYISNLIKLIGDCLIGVDDTCNHYILVRYSSDYNADSNESVYIKIIFKKTNDNVEILVY